MITLKSELARHLVTEEPDRCAQELSDIERVARQTLREVREAVAGYRHPRLESELEGARQLLSAAGIDYQIETLTLVLPPETSAVLAWTVREGVTNVIRHGRARHCEITLIQGNGTVGAEVINDGGRAARAESPSERPGLGLAGLRERAGRTDGGRPSHVVRQRTLSCAGGTAPKSGWRGTSLPGGTLMIRVLLAEDQAMVRGALAALLSREQDIEVVAEVARGDEVVQAALASQPDVALLDIEMPGGDGLAAAQGLQKALPSCRSVILTTFGRSGYLRRAMESGAVGFLLKDAPAAELAIALRRVMAGERVVDPELALSALSEGNNPLTTREREVLSASLFGASLAEIAARLILSEGTVRNHLSTAMQKLGAQNRMEAARLAEQKGWL
jgi:two-component system response regulator DesR